MEHSLNALSFIHKYCILCVCNKCGITTKSKMYCSRCATYACILCKSKFKTVKWTYRYGEEYICLWHILMQCKYNRSINRLCQITPLKERIAQTIIVSCDYKEDQPLSLIRNGLVGGLFIHNNFIREKEVKECIDTLKRYHSEANKFPLLICADQEGGDEHYTLISNYNGITTYCPGEMGKRNDKLFSYQCGANSGKLLSMIGVQISIAPVVDVCPLDNKDSRHFGSNPSNVAEHARMYIQGLHSQRIYSSIKHLGYRHNSLIPFAMLSDITDLITVSPINTEDLMHFRKASHFEGIFISESPRQNYMDQLLSNLNIIWVFSINDYLLSKYCSEVSQKQKYIEMVNINFKKVMRLKFKFIDYCDAFQNNTLMAILKNKHS